jgi:subtilase family serine protease
MAKMKVNGIEYANEALNKMGRPFIRKVVEAGVKAETDRMKARIRALHPGEGEMEESVAPGIFHEGPDSTWQDVYPQGLDSRGQENNIKAFVINYGRGGRKTDRMRDYFITKDNEAAEVVQAAMQAEADRLMSENS